MSLDLVFCGTYTDLNKQAGRKLSPNELVMGLPAITGSQGIYVFRYNQATGEFQLHQSIEADNASFLALDSTERFLFAANEVREFRGEYTGALSSYRIERETGTVRLVSQVPSGGVLPCHLSVSPDDRFLLVANYESGSVGVFGIDEGGALSECLDLKFDEPTDPLRQPRAHYISADPTGGFVLSTDLGTDRIMVYRLDPKSGRLTANDPAFAQTHPNGTPRHLSFSPSGHHVFASGEQDSTLSIFRFDSVRGTLRYIDHVTTMPAAGSEPSRNSTAHVLVHPHGRFAYVSNRGLDSIAVIEFDEATGVAAPVAFEPTRGSMPRHFQLEPSGRAMYVANQNSASIQRFLIDNASGRLSYTGQVAVVPAPTCILFTQT